MHNWELGVRGSHLDFKFYHSAVSFSHRNKQIVFMKAQANLGQIKACCGIFSAEETKKVSNINVRMLSAEKKNIYLPLNFFFNGQRVMRSISNFSKFRISANGMSVAAGDPNYLSKPGPPGVVEMQFPEKDAWWPKFAKPNCEQGHIFVGCSKYFGSV